MPSTVDDWGLDSHISHQCFLRKLEVINKKLNEHLRKQRWPKLTHVDVGGAVLQLPIKPEALLASKIPSVQADLAYLAGVFDGDGCVSPTADIHISSCRLIVGQVASNIPILLAFLCRFGGSIAVGNPGKGCRRPQVQWTACGSRARAVASELYEHSLVKREQLEIATNWPECRSRRMKYAARLKDLKRSAPNITRRVICWPYFTGFFDAEGCIVVSPLNRNVRVQVSQRDVPILISMQSFLLHELPAGSHVAVRKSSQFGHILEVSSRKAVLYILEKMVANRLLLKRVTAEHVLDSIGSSLAVLRGAEPLVKGNQALFRKLDAEGCFRASKIKRLQDKCRCARIRGHLLTVSELQNQLTDAKLEHAILNAMTRIKQLRSEIAKLRSQARHIPTKVFQWP